MFNPDRLDSFNPRAHTGRDAQKALDAEIEASFNPRAHTGRDANSNPSAMSWDVSIHAPTRGATQQHDMQIRKH